ncbi:protein of unknown function [Nitrospina watsonii]|uniref:Uncharacterized protein n=1 Tax=Nitrospina watsonii TaxID=1323948 RepID=A0ABM9HH24_9BACT|nr:protein of unknown function [Nitrospina watsonii]
MGGPDSCTSHLLPTRQHVRIVEVQSNTSQFRILVNQNLENSGITGCLGNRGLRRVRT